MTQNTAANLGFRSATKSDGTIVPFDVHTGYCTLNDNSTYYFPIGGVNADTPGETALIAAHLQSSTAAFAAVTTYEDSNMVELLRGSDRGAAFVTNYSSTAGDWIPENPSTAIVGTAGTGWSSAAATVTALGTGVGGAMFHIGNTGAKRGRLKVVTTVGGQVRVAVNGKLSA